jgi:hypothetical protein
MGFAGDDSQVDKQSLHQLFNGLLSVKADRIKIRLSSTCNSRLAVAKSFSALASHSLTVAFIQYFPMIQSFSDQGITLLIPAFGILGISGQEVDWEKRIGPIKNFQ